MKYQWTPQDLKRIREIFEMTTGPKAHEKLQCFIETKKFPLRRGSDRLVSGQKIVLALAAAQQLARRHGWITQSHNAKIHALGWSEKKKRLFKLLYEKKDYDHERFAEHGEFKGDFAKYQNKESAVHNFARQIGCDMKKRKETALKRKPKKEEKPPVLVRRRWPDQQVLEITKEAWERPGVRVGALSRFDWKEKGARAGLILRAFEICVARGCHYNVLNGGLVSRKYVEKRIKEEREKCSTAQWRVYKKEIEEYVLQELANELNSIIPYIRKPLVQDKADQVEFVRLYIMPSRIIDGKYYGRSVARLLQQMRPDIRLEKQGGAWTRLKGVGATEDERRIGQFVGWLNPKKHRLPGQYASTAIDKEVQEEEAGAERHPTIQVVGGFGVSTSKPGGGEKKRPRISLPVLHVPLPREEGEPSLALNQVGVRIIESGLDGESRLIQTWSLRDLTRDERLFVTGIKDGATDLHRAIVEAIKKDPERQGLHPGVLAEMLEVDREKIEKEIQFLVEAHALKRTTWPGLYRHRESGHYNFHLDWFQERLRYPWPYDKDYYELRRLLFGCLHAGYNTTDYEFVRHRLPEIIFSKRVKIVELIGDITAGLKHHLIHRGQIIGSLNYTEQEIFAAELLGTVHVDVFKKYFEEFSLGKGGKPSVEELEMTIRESLVLFNYIVGNHEEWQKENGHTPGVTFRDKLIGILNRAIGRYLDEQGFFTPRLEDIIRSKTIELPEYEAIYSFPDGTCTELLHPRMGRTKTTSIRMEEAFDFSHCQRVDTANYHTSFMQEKWDSDIGQRIGVQAGAMTPLTYFEHGKLKRIDFGPVYVGDRCKNGRIFMSEHEFFNKPILQRPISKDTDINRLKEKLNLLRAPM